MARCSQLAALAVKSEVPIAFPVAEQMQRALLFRPSLAKLGIDNDNMES